MPLVRLVIPLIFGIVTYLMLQNRLPEPAFVSAYLLLVIVWMAFCRYWLSHFSRRWVFGMMVFLMLYVLGYHLAQCNNQLYHDAHFSKYLDKEGFLVVGITEPVSEKANSFQVVGEVQGFFPLAASNLDEHKEGVTGYSVKQSENPDNGADKRTGFDTSMDDLQGMPARVIGNIILYLEKDGHAAALSYGDFIVIENSYESVSPPQNPRQFHYKRFLAYQNIFHSSYRQSGSWHHTGVNRGSPWKRWSLQLREDALMVFSGHRLQGREFAVVSALLLGYREYLDDDLQREFAGAGAMHILCVSGLHVGIIYLVLKVMLSFLKKWPGGIVIHTVLILMLIWLYASITGFSPSVLRASAMFSFVAIGQSMNRRTNIYNTLAASALLLLIIDPFIITRIGFQLSYLAVISIVSLQPWLYRKLLLKNKLLDKAWGIITVSIAAQVATGPLSLLYFHQFPNYFLLTNLIVIPLSGLIIYSSLLTLVLTPIPFLGAIAGKLLYGLLYVLHTSVKYIEGIPYSTSVNVYIGITETLLLFVFLIFGCIYLITKRRSGLKVALVSLLVLVCCFSFRSIRLDRQEHFVVYSVNNATVIDFFLGREKLVFACDRIINEPGMGDYQTYEYRISKGVTRAVRTINVKHSGISKLQRPLPRSYMALSVGSFWRKTLARHSDHAMPPLVFKTHEGKDPASGYMHKENPDGVARYGHYIQFGNKTLFLLSRSHKPIQHQSKESINFPVDYLVVCQNPRVSPETYLDVFTPSLVILDASNNHWNVSRWETACDSLGVACWPVRERGAFLGVVSSYRRKVTSPFPSAAAACPGPALDLLPFCCGGRAVSV